MKDAPAFDFFPERWLAGVAMFSDAEQLAYLRLLCHQWIMDGLPESAATLKRLAGRGCTEAILEKFPVADDGKRRNAFLEKLRAEQRDRIAKARASAQARWGKRTCSTDANASPKHMRTHDSSIISPLTTHQVLASQVTEAAPQPPAVKQPKAGKEDDFAKACAVTLDLLAPELVREAWAEYQAERQRRHRASTAKGFQPWTFVAATRAAKHITDHLDKLTPQQIADHIRAAINAGWKGLFLEKLNEPTRPLNRFPHQDQRGAAPRFAALQQAAPADGHGGSPADFRV